MKRYTQYHVIIAANSLRSITIGFWRLFNERLGFSDQQVYRYIILFFNRLFYGRIFLFQQGFQYMLRLNVGILCIEGQLFVPVG